jgi:hypothetical protein
MEVLPGESEGDCLLRCAMSAGEAKEALAMICSSDRVIDDLEKTMACVAATCATRAIGSTVGNCSVAGGIGRSVQAEEDLTSFREGDVKPLQDHALHPLCLVLRPFVSIPRWAELRGFVCQGRLTALSQYFADETFPILIRYREGILRHVANWFYHMVHPALVVSQQYRHVVLDIALVRKPSASSAEVEEEEEGALVIEGWPMQAVLIELNSFGIRSGGSLFDWDEDHALLLGCAGSSYSETAPGKEEEDAQEGRSGRALPEFRVLME